MTEDYARILKRRTLIALVATLLSLVLLFGAMFWLWCSLLGHPETLRRDRPQLTTQSVQIQPEPGAPTLSG